MENHAIPQDITGFQFKLIGDMTIKQFAYLATGSVLGWIIFSLPIIGVIKLPFVGFLIFLGIAFAFFSIAGRPLDIMIVNFFKATFSPTQYIYGETRASMQLDKRAFNFFENLHFPKIHLLQKAQRPPTPQILTAVQIPEITEGTEKSTETQRETEKEKPKIEELSQEAQVLERELQKAKVEEQMLQDSPPKADQPGAEKLYEEAHQKVIEIEKLLNETLLQKQSLENQIISLKRELEESKKEVYIPKASEEIKESKLVRSIPKSMGKEAGIPIAPEFPNIISGIVKDPRGNPLPNILVEVKDKEGNPVRAFKTNPLGQFTASTPLLINGTYRIEFEDTKGEHKFDLIEFEASGDVILPIEVISQDLREELRKSLFNPPVGGPKN